MIIARVLEHLVATRKHPSHEGRKLLLVQPLNLDGSAKGEPVVALDAAQAGVGERVLVVQDGYAAMSATGRPDSPIDTAVIGVIESVTVEEGVSGESR